MARDIGDQMMLAEWLFTRSVEDLRSRAANPESDRYTLLGIAPLLRKLLSDGQALIETVGVKRQGVPALFRIAPFVPKDGSVVKTLIGFGGLELMSDARGQGVPLEEFLSTSIGVVEDQPISVGETIRYFSHVEGGVHFGVPRSEAERLLATYTPSLFALSIGWAGVLAVLGTITANALAPLVEEIRVAPTDNPSLHVKSEAGAVDGHWTRRSV